jgi:hypothetical protein
MACGTSGSLHRTKRWTSRVRARACPTRLGVDERLRSCEPRRRRRAGGGHEAARGAARGEGTGGRNVARARQRSVQAGACHRARAAERARPPTRACLPGRATGSRQRRTTPRPSISSATTSHSTPTARWCTYGGAPAAVCFALARRSDSRAFSTSDFAAAKRDCTTALEIFDWLDHGCGARCLPQSPHSHVMHRAQATQRRHAARSAQGAAAPRHGTKRQVLPARDGR